MNYFDDIAMCQSEKLGVGIDYLKERNIAWMLYKWDITIHKYPVYGEIIKVRTVPNSFKKFYAYRRFDILNGQGEKFVSANSLWLLINTDKKRPIKITKDMYKAYQVRSDEPSEIRKITGPSTIDMEKEFNVRYSDIDTNRHVNNVKYAAWAIETIPLDIVLNYTLANLKVIYKKETTYGKTIKALTQVKTLGDSITCMHSIVDENNKELCILESQWLKTS